MINHIKHFLGHNIINTLGWHSNRKIIIIESDDWGSIRMPSIETLNRLINQRLKFNLEFGYDKYDTIASQSDLENLFEVLNSVHDHNNHPAVITANTVTANPDYEKIKSSEFSTYHYELITETLKNYYPQADPFIVWKQGIDGNVFHPQFHGREHLNVRLWLNLLRKNVNGAREAFYETVFTQLMNISDDNRVSVLAAYDYQDKSEQQFIKNSITEGLQIFENLFGYRSASAISPCYVWDDFVEKCYLDEGVKFIQGSFFQSYPTYLTEQKNKKGQFHFSGERNKNGQYYLVRNCFFEPSQYPNTDYVDDCMHRIKIAFRWKKPAIISAHRLNFIGSLDVRNRDRNLKSLSILLRKILNKWPDAEFMTSDQLGSMILNKQSNKNIL